MTNEDCARSDGSTSSWSFGWTGSFGTLYVQVIVCTNCGDTTINFTLDQAPPGDAAIADLTIAPAQTSTPAGNAPTVVYRDISATVENLSAGAPAEHFMWVLFVCDDATNQDPEFCTLLTEGRATLAGNDSSAVSYRWDATGWLGDYTICAVARVRDAVEQNFINDVALAHAFVGIGHAFSGLQPPTATAGGRCRSYR